MNFSVFFIEIARRAVERVRDNPGYNQPSILEAVVFAWFSIEALLNEQAYIETTQFGNGDAPVYSVLERGAGGFERIQAILVYFYGQALKDGDHPANDLKHLGHLRNGIAHYRFEDPPARTLDDLAQRGFISKPDVPWSQNPFAWPSHVQAGLAGWAYNTACDTARAIADLLPSDEAHEHEASLIRHNFGGEVRPLSK